ncbi:MAG: hypothetical protein WA777_11270 [Rhodanobacter sp.]
MAHGACGGARVGVPIRFRHCSDGLDPFANVRWMGVGLHVQMIHGISNKWDLCGSRRATTWWGKAIARAGVNKRLQLQSMSADHAAI